MVACPACPADAQRAQLPILQDERQHPANAASSHIRMNLQGWPTIRHQMAGTVSRRQYNYIQRKAE